MKKRQTFLYLLVICTSLFVSCNKSDEEKPITSEDVEKAFQEIDLSPGVRDVELEVSKNVFYNFRIIIPDVDHNQRWPLILALHGASGGSPDAHKTTACYIEPGLEGLDAFVIHPNAGIYEWYETPNQDKVQYLLSLATKYWPIDFDKIVAMGYSNGGNATWLFAEAAPHVFSAGIALASSYDLSVSETTSRKIQIPMYVIHSDSDELFPIDITRKWVNQSITAGSDITFVVAEGLSHYAPCEYVPYVKDAVKWLTEYAWKK